MYFYIQIGVNSWGIYTVNKDNVYMLDSVGLLSDEEKAKEYVVWKTSQVTAKAS